MSYFNAYLYAYIYIFIYTCIYPSHFLVEILLFLIIFNLVSCFYIGSHLGHSLFLTLFTVCARPPPLFPPQHVSLRHPGAEWLNAVLKGEIGLRRSEGCIQPSNRFTRWPKFLSKGENQNQYQGALPIVREMSFSLLPSTPMNSVKTR